LSHNLKPLPKTTWRLAKESAYRLRDGLARAYGRPSGGMTTDLIKDGRKVIFIHNPKTAGTSLGTYLGVRRRTHTLPVDRINRSHWLSTYSIVSVRDPFERFLSGYFDHVCKPKDNALTRIYGHKFKSLSPLEYLQILLSNPGFGGPQLRWASYPSTQKPCADLVLRFEQIGLWEQQIASQGIIITGRALPHRNVGPLSGVNLSEALKMDSNEVKELESIVRRQFRDDALAFGYPVE